MKIKRNVRKTNVPKTRKELRKEKRLLKKQHRHEYYTNRNKPGRCVLRPKGDDETEQSAMNVKLKSKAKPDAKIKKQENANNKTLLDDGVKFIVKEKRQQAKLQKEMRQQRNKQLLQANAEEDLHIKQLEKQLKLKKRKSIPSSFASEGLDYLLELCDPENMKSVLTTDQMEEDDGFKEDFELMSGNKLNGEISEEDGSDFEESNSDEHSIDDDELDKSSSDSGEEDVENNKKQKDSGSNKRKPSDISDEEEVKKHKIEVAKSDSEDSDDGNISGADDSDDEQINDQKDDETWEDIYGRTRRKDGSIITAAQNKKYVPPGMRDKDENDYSRDKQSTEKFNRLKRQLKGLLNRLAEANMHNISSQIEVLYMNNSRNDMNNVVITLMMESLASNVLTPERLLLEHISLITILHANIGMEIGAHFLQTLVKEFNELFNTEQEIENKTVDNIIISIAQLYNFKVFHSQLLYQILTKLSDKFDEKSLDCILLILKSVGFSLRKDDPLALKSLILGLQKRAASASDDMKDNFRVKFMLDILLAIKNNNVSKIPNYDVSYSEHLKKLLKSFVRKGNYVTQLNVSLDDLLKADERGKWWIVGSAWTGKSSTTQSARETPQVSEFSQNLLELARKQRMNTDTRCNIFCIIMSAEDYLDAFEKLLRLGLKNQQEREIVHVILHCCLQEKNFNPYYAVLAQKFCEYDRKYQMIIKYSVWDKLKMLTDCPACQISNLAKFLTHLFIEKGLPISVLKMMRFADLDKVTLRFIRQIMLGILLHEDTEACVGVFEKLSQSEKLKMFRESLRLFVHHFVLRNLSENVVPQERKTLLLGRADLIEKMLTVNEKKMKF